MDINEIPRGQLSTIILTTLLDADKYGLEIIEEIEKKTFGEVVIKKPSLYSSLNRMEKQDLVSSYWKDSDIGGRRHYYRLTDFGRKQVLQWQNELLSSQTKVSKILSQTEEQEKKPVQQNDSLKPIILEQANLFNFTSPAAAQTENVAPKPAENAPNAKTQDFLQYDLFSQSNFISYPDTQEPTAQHFALNQQPTVFNFKEMEKVKAESENPIVVKKEDEAIVAQPKQETIKEEPLPKSEKKIVQVKTNFNFESEYEKYAKSFSSYAGTMQSNAKNANGSVFSPFNAAKSDIITDFSSSMFSRGKFDEENAVEEDNVGVQPSLEKFDENEQTKENDEVEQEKPHDDAVLITVKAPEELLPKVRKITPAVFNVKSQQQKQQQATDFEKQKAYIESENIIKQKEEKTVIQTEKLKEYFAAKNINYTPYSKKLQHNLPENKTTQKADYIKINKFKMFTSLILFFALFVQSATLFLVLNHFGLFNIASSLWILIATNVLSLGWFAYNLIVFLQNKNKTVLKKNIIQNPLWYKVVFIVIGLILVYALHLLGGLNEFNYTSYLTTLILPVILVFDYLVLHFVNLFATKTK